MNTDNDLKFAKFATNFGIHISINRGKATTFPPCNCGDSMISFCKRNTNAYKLTFYQD